jgi:HEAT repeat protein
MIPMRSIQPAPAGRGASGWLAAILAIAIVGCHHKKAVEDLPVMDELAQQMRSNDKDMRYDAVKRLPRLGPTNKDAVPLLIAALADSSEDVRWVATDGLAKSGTAAAAATPKLIDALHDRYPLVRAGAAHALSSMGTAGLVARPALTTALNDRDADVRDEAKRALATLQNVQKYQSLQSQSSK